MSQDIINKQIFYDKSTKFNIIPSLDNEMINEFVTYMETFHHNHNDDTFFWVFDQNIGAIIINETTNTVEDDIFNQLITIYYWLYKKGHHLEGSTYYRTNNLIEYICMDSMISHYILFDEINIYNEMLMYNSKNKLLTQLNSQNKTILQNSWPTKKRGKKYNGKKPLIINNNNDNNNKNIVREEDLRVIKRIQERLSVTENQIKSLTRRNNFLWKICGALSLFTFSSYLLCVSLSHSHCTSSFGGSMYND